ncbi:MAG TPA: M1 family metallopeptidase [Pirellulaceae bacterium]|nr:M1 family metallopeptidase [Pirellulaceae bacterium]
MNRRTLRQLSIVAASLAALLVPASLLSAQVINRKYGQEDKFRQLDEILPTPNDYRTASGAPGHEYWQQRADYEISVTLLDDERRIVGDETITYTNLSPDPLSYIWIQLDPNLYRPDAPGRLTEVDGDPSRMSFDAFKAMRLQEQFDGGVELTRVQDGLGNALPYVVVGTMMRIDLPLPLQPGTATRLGIGWTYAINDTKYFPGRTGFEHFAEDDNCIYEMAQWFPRVAAYTDYQGWQHKQYLGRGEFTLEFGDYVVRITAPADHVVASTGVLLNPDEVLKPEWRERLEQAKGAEKPVFVVTPEEAKANETSRATETKTWIFKADEVRDFAWASSRKFIWDAWEHDVEGNKVMAMSFYPNEAEPLWSRYSTHAIVHTLDVYSRYTFRYPYPVAISVNGPVGGMEYPMICFNGPRPEKDGTYSSRTKYGLISVVIHEVGHNYFPMIVNSDERQWTWMDEGLNTFLQYLAECEWEENYPSSRGEPKRIVGYMSSRDQVPIMTNSESILQFGPNAYSKPATALNILRETILGREVFDFAFREYARRWQNRRPTPADFFRTMEDASGTDLDWFFRGWFYTTDHVDIALAGVREFTVDTTDPDVEKQRRREERDAEPQTLAEQRNAELPKRTEAYPELLDFYNEFDELNVTDAEREAYRKALEGLTDEQREFLQDGSFYYVLDFVNEGGLVMPILLDLELEDGSHQEVRIPAEIWRRNSERVSKMVVVGSPIRRIVLDPHLETADVDRTDNYFPPEIPRSRFELFRDGRSGPRNEMQRAGLGQEQPSAEAETEAGSAEEGAEGEQPRRRRRRDQ